VTTDISLCYIVTGLCTFEALVIEHILIFTP